MKILLGILVGVAASKPLLKAADKYVGKGWKVTAIGKLDDALYSLRNRTSDYIKDNV